MAKKTKGAEKETGPHEKLREIRRRLGLTQAKMAGLLGIGEQSLEQFEKGKRELPQQLVVKIQNCFGVSRILNRKEHPFLVGRRGILSPFTDRSYREYSMMRPSFSVSEGEGRVSPTNEDLANCVAALLDAAEQEGRLRFVLHNLFAWFRDNATFEIIQKMKPNLDRLSPRGWKNSDAFLSLTMSWGAESEDVGASIFDRKEKAAERIAKKRKRRRKRAR